MRATDRLVRLVLITLLALPLGAQGLGAQTENGGYGSGDPGGDPMCWQGCAAIEGQDPGLIRTRIWESGGLNESILTGPPGEETAARAAVEGAGGQVLRRSEQRALGQVSLIAIFPGDAARERALARLARTAPATGMSVNWTYTHAQAAAPRLYAPELIGDAAPGRCRLSAPLRIGMIDGPLNPGHPALRGARVNYTSLIGDLPPSPADHGTAVAALMVGEDPTGIMAGFARGADLHAVAVFSRQGGRDESSVERIVQALDLLVSRDVRLINISIAGPRSPAMQSAISAAAARGVVLVAASGNDGVRQVAYPAEAPEVIAVTAVDSIKRRYRLANFGNEIEFAAPGVDVYTALATGGGYGSGTSFAAPIVTSLIAREMARGMRGDASLRARMRAGAEALGDGRRNPEFGYGLVRAAGC